MRRNPVAGEIRAYMHPPKISQFGPRRPPTPPPEFSAGVGVGWREWVGSLGEWGQVRGRASLGSSGATLGNQISHGIRPEILSISVPNSAEIDRVIGQKSLVLGLLRCPGGRGS